MAVLDADRVLLAVNASMTDTLGYAADQMIGRRADAAWSTCYAGTAPSTSVWSCERTDDGSGGQGAAIWPSGAGEPRRAGAQIVQTM